MPAGSVISLFELSKAPTCWPVSALSTACVVSQVADVVRSFPGCGRGGRVATRVLLVNPKTKYETERDLAEYRKVAAVYNIAIDPFEIADHDVRDAFAKLEQAGCDGVVHSSTSIFGLLRTELAHAALSARIPLLGNLTPYTSDGALLSYGPLVRDGLSSTTRRSRP
jgi:hypothetical protein